MNRYSFYLHTFLVFSVSSHLLLDIVLISNTRGYTLMKRKLALLYNKTNSRRLLKLLRFSFTTRSRMTSKSSSSNAEEDPQCNLVGNVSLDSLSLNQQQQSETSSESSQLESLSDDLLLNVLLYCGPNEVESNIKLVSRRLQ